MSNDDPVGLNRGEKKVWKVWVQFTKTALCISVFRAAIKSLPAGKSLSSSVSSQNLDSLQQYPA